MNIYLPLHQTLRLSAFAVQLFNSLPLIPFVILKDKLPEAIERGIKSLAIIHLRKLPNKFLQVGIAGYHKSDDRYFQPS